jgi:hypothetical protein
MASVSGDVSQFLSRAVSNRPLPCHKKYNLLAVSSESAGIRGMLEGCGCVPFMCSNPSHTFNTKYL